VHDVGHAEDVGRGALLGGARGGEPLRGHLRVVGALAAVGGHDIVDPRTVGGELRDRRPGAELGVVGVADDDEHAFERRDQLVALGGTHTAMLPGSAGLLD
jgi:hypothetical protein